MNAHSSSSDVHVLLDSIDSIVWEFDLATQRFTMVSRQAERMLGYPVEAWIDDPAFWIDHMHPDDRAWAPGFCASQTLLKRGHEFDYRMIARDGRTVWLRDIVTVVTEAGAPVFLRGVMVDITRGKNAEAERDRLLASERVARSAAEEALRLRDEFLSIAAHELATPLTPLLLRIQSMRRRLERTAASSPGDGEMLHGIQAIERSATHFRALLDSLLDMSRQEPVSLAIAAAPEDLVNIVREVIDDFEVALRNAGCSLELHAPSPVVGRWDRTALIEVFANLMSNAIKYGARGLIALRVEASGANARVLVRDHGCGVRMADTDRIFGKFERATSTRNYGGFGLGLYIARRIVEAHGGTLCLIQASGPGATFAVELPLQP